MASLLKCWTLQERVGGWEWVDMMVLYCQNAAADDREFTRRINAILQEMVVAYDERVDFIRELELRSHVHLYCRCSIDEDLRLAGKINAFYARLTDVIDERENFVDELNVLVGRFVSEKMVEFIKVVQGKDIPNLMKL
nr:hypothetical protein [Tanacetum cinerariifolium]